jgi:hypothetical protein
VVRDLSACSSIISAGIFGDVKFHLYVPGHRSAVVKVFYVKSTKLCVRRGNGAVDKKFGGDQAGCLCGSWARIIEAISTGTVAHAMGFGFGWAKRCFLLAVSDFTSGRYIAFMDKEVGVCTSNSLTSGRLLANTLSESAEVVCHTAQP